MFYLFIISLFCLGALFAMGGVVLGGWLVYRTKRDHYEPMFSKAGKGDSFNIDDDFTITEDAPAKLHPITEKANDKFVKQFASDLADKVG